MLHLLVMCGLGFGSKPGFGLGFWLICSRILHVMTHVAGTSTRFLASPRYLAPRTFTTRDHETRITIDFSCPGHVQVQGRAQCCQCRLLIRFYLLHHLLNPP
ncbi:hypothetical protein CPB84DRAFT_606232 [Gymnopilus junonius]|uniref:Uncharacterized protein n=1 Tax=Gymnopilus junonius TaxID=109634 RepID=A0A9P5N868_GYMJU|nr:hypothetical protein CPB84DRAFT_606232 [Gymnopilus junonius]